MSSKDSVVATVKTAGKVLALFLVVFSIVSYSISLALGPVLFFSTSDGLSVASRIIRGIPIDLFIAVPVFVPLQISMGTLFFAIWLVFVLCVVFAWFDRGGFLKSLKGTVSENMPLAKANFLLVMPIVATALLSATVMLQQFQESEGVQTGSLSFPSSTPFYEILLNLAFAPLREELAFRITSIGIPIGIFLVFLYRHDKRVSGLKNSLKLILLAMVSPEHAKVKMDYRNVSGNGFLRGIGPLEWVLILVTSAIFGLAHYLLGGGWQLGKISTAFLAGLMLGIVFVAYGAYASIILHWFFNYYFTVIDLAGSTYGGVFQVVSNLVELTNATAGYIILLVFLLFSAVKLGDYFSLKASGLNRQQVP